MAARAESRTGAARKARAREVDLAAEIGWLLPLVLFVVALAARLLYLGVFSNPENPGDGIYTDAYHHWQIAYLSQHLGLPQGRLWDLKGVEYFWGVLHPGLLMLLFAVSHSSDLVLSRLLSALAGAAMVVLAYHLAKRYWGITAGLLVGAAWALLPFAVFNDAAGMEEQLAYACILGGLVALPRRPLLAGSLWALAATDRAEMWLITLGLVALNAALSEDAERRFSPLRGWLLVIVPYAWFLWTRTGNPVYPVYWNLFGHVGGQWLHDPSAQQEAVRPAFIALTALSAGGLVAVLWRRPRGALLLAFGFASTALTFALYGFTSFITDWTPSTWFARHMELPYLFTTLLAVVGLLRLSARVRWGGVAATAVVLLALAAAQSAWSPMRSTFAVTDQEWNATQNAGSEIGYEWARGGANGAVNIPGDRPDLTYALVRYGRVDANHLVGQFYDPYGLLPGLSSRSVSLQDTALQCWLDKTETSVWVVSADRGDYASFISRHQDWFQLAANADSFGWSVYRVREPHPGKSACDSAWRAAGGS